MRDFHRAILACAFLSWTIPVPAQVPLPQQEQQREIDRRIDEEARRREADERAREQEKLDQLQEDMTQLSRTAPMTPEEIEALRKRFFPHFARNVTAFDGTSRQLADYTMREELDPMTLREVK